jgi:predicted metal-dependent hydrolase
MQHQIKFGSRTIVFNLKHRKRKSLGIKVHPDCGVEVLAPIAAKEDQVFESVKIKAPWILKQIDHFNTYKPSTPIRRFINGETHLYLGRQYRLKIVPGDVDEVKAYRGQLWMHSQNPTPEVLKVQLDKWYKQRAYIVFNELLEEILPKFKRYKISEPVLTIRTMSKRWGSCTPAGKIILNTELIKAPKGSIEYVIIHELCHLVHHNHTKAFQNLQSRMLPDWQRWKDRLEYSLA